MASVVSVERVLLSFTTGATERTAALSKGQSFGNELFPLSYTQNNNGDDRYGRFLFEIDIIDVSGTPTVRARRYQTGSTADVYVTVIEGTFDSVQGGSFSITSGGLADREETLPSAVNTANAFVIFNYRMDTTADDTSSASFVRAWLTDGSTVRFENDNSALHYDMDFQYWVVEDTDFTVQTVVGAMDSSTEIADNAISAVDLAKTLLFCSHERDHPDVRNEVLVYPTSTTNIRAERSSGGTAVNDAAYAIQVVESDLFAVQYGTFSVLTTDTTGTITITSVDLDRAAAISTMAMGSGMVDSSSDHFRAAGYDFDDATTLRWNTDNSGAYTYAWQVVEFASSAGGLSTSAAASSGAWDAGAASASTASVFASAAASQGAWSSGAASASTSAVNISSGVSQGAWEGRPAFATAAPAAVSSAVAQGAWAGLPAAAETSAVSASTSAAVGDWSGTISFASTADVLATSSVSSAAWDARPSSVDPLAVTTEAAVASAAWNAGSAGVSYTEPVAPLFEIELSIPAAVADVALDLTAVEDVSLSLPAVVSVITLNLE